jgi:hypothetical protein
LRSRGRGLQRGDKERDVRNVIIERRRERNSIENQYPKIARNCLKAITCQDGHIRAASLQIACKKAHLVIHLVK